MRFRFRLPLPLILLLGTLLTLAAIEAVRAHVRITTELTWSEDIRPIFEAKCMSCHSPGGIAPAYVDLTTYGNKPGQSGARDWAKAIEEELLTDRMPPWKADARFGRFRNHRFLTEEEEKYIIAWIRGGAPQGPRRDLPAPEQFTKRDWNFGTPDYVVELPGDHTVPAETNEEVFAVTIPLQLEKDEWITGFEFFPGNPRIIHSIQALIHDPAGAEPEVFDVEVTLPYDPLASEDELEKIEKRTLPPGPHFLGQWMRGDAPVLLPDEAGRRVRKGGAIELRIVYRKLTYEDQGQAFTDRTRLGLFFASEPVDLIVESRKIENAAFTLPADAADTEVSASLTLDEDVRLLAFHPQMNRLGRSLRLRATFPDGETQTLLHIPAFQSKWNSSFILDQPVPAPKGTVLELVGRYDNSTANADNPNRPPLEVKSGAAPGEEQLALWVDLALETHLYTPPPPPPPKVAEEGDRGGMLAPGVGGDVLSDVQPEVGAIFSQLVDKDLEPAAADASTSTTAPAAGATPAPAPAPLDEETDPDGVYWCPMRGTAEGQCGLKDYTAPGVCDVCGMKLKPRSFFLKRYEGKLAATQGEWRLTRAGAEEIYWCPERGRADHDLIDYEKPGVCPIDGLTLLHKSRFEPVRTFVCLTEACPDKGRTFFSSGLCPTCQQPVQSMGHMDHTPVHGGQLIMADNLYHHLEGTLPAPDTFHLFFYNDWKEPLDPRNFAGKVVMERWDEATEDVVTEEFELRYASDGDPFLTATIPAVAEFPVNFDALVWLAGKETLFSFAFDALSDEAAAEQAQMRLHAHTERAPVVIPETADAIAREIYNRDRILRDRIAARDWFALHNPAFDAKDFAEALKTKEQGLGPRERADLRAAIDRITQGAIFLDRAGDTQDEPRVKKAYATFSEGIAALHLIFPED